MNADTINGVMQAADNLKVNIDARTIQETNLTKNFILKHLRLQKKMVAIFLYASMFYIMPKISKSFIKQQMS